MIKGTRDHKPRQRTLPDRIKLFLSTPLGGRGKEKEDFIENLALLVDSGLDIISSLHAVRFDTRTPQMLELIDGVIDDVDSGSPLWKALERQRMLKSYMITFIRIGEESGKLSENLELVVVQIKKNKLFRSKLVSAMLYPGIILGLSLFLGLGIFIFVIPRLATVYSALDIELPLITEVLIATGNFLSRYGIIVIPLIISIIGWIYYFLFVRSKSKFIGQRMLFKLRPLRIVISNVELARFGFLLGTLLEAGLPILDAINSLERSSDFYHYKRFYRYLALQIEDGFSFADTFKSYKGISLIFPLPVQQILISAERSGNMVRSLKQIGERFEDRIDSSSRNLSVLLEPVMLVAVWLGVVFVALSVILPVYNLVGNVSNTRNTNNNRNVEGTPLPTPKVYPQVSLKDEFDTVDLYTEPDGAILETSPDRIYRFDGENNGWYLLVTSSGKPRGWAKTELFDVESDR